jgi:glutamine synthetase
MSANVSKPSERINGLLEPKTELRGRVTMEELVAAGERGEIDTVFLVVPDNAGRLRGSRMRLHVFRDHVESNTPIPFPLAVWGVDVESEFRFGLEPMGGPTSGGRDCFIEPDLGSLRLLPWLERTVVVFCEAVFHGGEVFPFSPRTILRRQLERLDDLGFRIKAATELEFNLFSQNYVEAWDDCYRNLTPSSRYLAPYDTLQPVFDDPFLDGLLGMLDLAGIEVEGLATEYGRGQQELNLRYCDPIEMADRHALYKWGAKALAAKLGMSVTFMAKWKPGELGNSCHVHTSLWGADGTARGCDDGSETVPSRDLSRFLAGMLDTTREMSYLYAPTLNSYRRFAPDSFAPTVLAWGEDNRTCSFRVLGSGPSLRIENRVPGADVNPYLALAAMVASGMHGLEGNLEPPPPVKENAYEKTDCDVIPGSLPESLDLFECSEAAVRAFSPEVHRHLLMVGREELAAFLTETVTDWEMRRYFERI